MLSIVFVWKTGMLNESQQQPDGRRITTSAQSQMMSPMTENPGSGLREADPMSAAGVGDVRNCCPVQKWQKRGLGMVKGEPSLVTMLTLGWDCAAGRMGAQGMGLLLISPHMECDTMLLTTKWAATGSLPVTTRRPAQCLLFVPLLFTKQA